MTISFTCEQCGKKYATPPEFAGKAIKCKQCATILRIPAASPSIPKSAPKVVRPPTPAKPLAEDLYDLAGPTPGVIALSDADAIDSSDDEIAVVPSSESAGVRRTWAKPAAGSKPSGKNPRRAPKSSTSEGVVAKVAGAGIGGLGVLFIILRIVLRVGNPFTNGSTPPPQPPGFAGQPRQQQPSGGVPTIPGWSASLVEARRGFQTKLTRRESSNEPVVEPPSDIFQVVKYRSPAGSLSAYLSPDPGDGKTHPAIVWITGGDCASIGEVWNPGKPENDQTASAFREAGIVMMFPSLRGGNDNPGVHEGFLGEVDDVLSAGDFLAKQSFVDRSRVYLGGHSTGGTVVLLAAASSDRFRAVFSFGPVAGVSAYPSEFTPFNTSDEREVAIRSPIFWLGSVRCPTYVIEGASQPGNVDSLQLMARNSSNPLLHFFPVNDANHFSILAPATKILAEKILSDHGPTANNLLRPGELNGAFGR